MTLTAPSRVETIPAIVKTTESPWNSYDSGLHTQTPESTEWRNNDKFFVGRDAVKAFLKSQGGNRHYTLTKELWASMSNCISVRYEYHWQHGPTGHWYRTQGNECWELVDDRTTQSRISAMAFRCVLRRTATNPLSTDDAGRDLESDAQRRVM